MSRPLRIAHLPINTASLPWHTARAQRRLGIDARVWEFAMEPSRFSSRDGVTFVRLPRSYRSLDGIRAYMKFLAVVSWADVLHWYGGTRVLRKDMDFKIVGLSGIPRIVEWMGSEIRDPACEIKDNPVFADEVIASGLQDVWSASRAMETQRAFADAGFLPACATGMVQYVREEDREKLLVVERAVAVADYVPSYPSAEKSSPVIAHAPSNMAVKGTRHVLAAAEALKERYSFGLDLISDVSHDVALARIAACDVFVDQLVLGDFGVAALEAMAMGKPVVAYLKPSLRAAYPSDLPIVDATPRTLGSVLMKLLQDGAKRCELGILGRRYVEKHANVEDRAMRLMSTYQEMLRRR